MGRKIQHKRGPKSSLPVLDIGELGLTTDERNLYVGTSVGNELIGGKQITDNINSLTEQLAESAINVKSFGAVGDGVIDDSQAFLDAVESAYVKGGIVLVPAGTYKITQTIFVKKGVYLRGVSMPHVWDMTMGSMIKYYGTGVAIQLSDDSVDTSGIGVSDIAIIDANDTGDVGLKIGGNVKWLHDVSFSNVLTVGFNTGIQINKSYGLAASLTKTSRPRQKGWHFTTQGGSLTLSTFTSCGGYNSVGDGWVIERDITYSSFNQCYFDGCDIGFKMTGYTLNKSLFNNCGLENYREYGFYLSHTQMIVGLTAPILVNNHKETVIDNIYFSGVGISLTNVQIPSSYSPSNGFDVNVVTGRAFCTDVIVNKFNGTYEGGYNSLETFNLPRSENILFNKVIVPSGSGAYSFDIRGSKNILGSSYESSRRISFTGSRKGQVLNIYGNDDLNKFFLDKFDFPKLPYSIYLGKGDFAKLVFDDLDGSGNAWHLIEIKTDRVGAAPSTGYWERGRKFWYVSASAGGMLGVICTVAGTPGTWKEFGTIST